MRQKLLENVRETAQILDASVWGFSQWDTTSTEAKDRDRITKILAKPEEKQIRAAEVMASKITHTDKAVRRARACAEACNGSNDEMVTEMTRIFLKRAVVLHVGQIPPTDIVKLKSLGAI